MRNTNDLLSGLERWHKLEVKVSRPGVKVRARRGYQATPPPWLQPPQPASKANTNDKTGPSKGPRRPLDPAVMTSGADETIALRVAPYVLEADKMGLARVLVALEVGTSTIALQGVYEILGMKDAEGNATTQVAGGYTLKTAAGRMVNAEAPTPIAVALGGRLVRMIALPLAGAEEGDYDLALEVVDHATGRTLITHETFALQREFRNPRPSS